MSVTSIDPPTSTTAPGRGLMRMLQSFWLTVAFALAFGFAFQGSRGLWETDEGRYTQVAMEMLRSGDFITPRRHRHHIHPTKPPMTYWAIASSVAQFGRNEWAVRAPSALAFGLTVGLLFGIGRRLTPALPGLPAALYATTALSFFAANLVTTDTLLTLMTTLGVFGYVGARWPLREGHRVWPWIVLMWAGFGLAFVTKGPPGLLPLAAIILFDALQPQRSTRQLFDPRGLLVFAVLGLSWYLAVVLRNPGLMTYLVEEEVVARVASSEHGRFPEWWGGFYVYGFTLLLGTLPWLPTLWQRAFQWPVTPARWSALSTDAKFLATWIALPLVIFMLARSRLPLYLLPLFPAIALVIARLWLLEPAKLARRIWWIPIVAVALVLIKGGSAHLKNNKDMRHFAKVIDRMVPYTPKEVVFIDESPRYGLGFYLDCPTEWVGLYDNQDVRYDDTLENELLESEGKRLFLVRPENYDHFVARSKEFGHHVQRFGESHRFVIAGARRDSDNRRN
ncbi:MAG: glycosyltransferase family 39 protein [Xanthomonadales bacterium]|nr:glycosyltransferase family 39 protein [Xanthomonadales bacterium]MBP6077238.1 glycosyltransferase family 39 protein [Xanthomonadales bacterium]MBP7622750.1 glycosyltransferase family 39 protein [Xanthomonadales bacterium]